MLSLPAKLYAKLMSWREATYSGNRLPRWRPCAPCISVGNIRWGGTGKTPFCQWLLHWAESRNLRPVLLTRGYKAQPPYLPYLVRPDAPVAQAGDEPLLLAQSAPGSHIIVDPKRIRSGPWAWKQFHPDLFVLDDGFQHLPVIRDLDLVLLLPDDVDQDWNKVVPSGPWREGTKALARADVFLIKADEQACIKLRPLIESRLKRFNKPYFFFSLEPCGLTDLSSNQQTQILERPYLLISGVGHPCSVEQTATNLLSATPRKHLAFADHYAFRHRDLHRILHEAQSLKVADVVCTAKDAVKLKPLLSPETALRWWRLNMKIVFGPSPTNQGYFEDWLEKWWEKRPVPRAYSPDPDPD